MITTKEQSTQFDKISELNILIFLVHPSRGVINCRRKVMVKVRVLIINVSRKVKVKVRVFVLQMSKVIPRRVKVKVLGIDSVRILILIMEKIICIRTPRIVRIIHIT